MSFKIDWWRTDHYSCRMNMIQWWSMIFFTTDIRFWLIRYRSIQTLGIQWIWLSFIFQCVRVKTTYRETHRTRNVGHLRNSSTISASIHEDSSIINRCYLSRASIWRTDLLIILKVGKYDNVRVYNIKNANISFCSPNILGSSSSNDRRKQIEFQFLQVQSDHTSIRFYVDLFCFFFGRGELLIQWRIESNHNWKHEKINFLYQSEIENDE